MIFEQETSSLGMFAMELAGTAESFYMSSDLIVTSIDRTSQLFNQKNDSGHKAKQEWRVIHATNGSCCDWYNLTLHLWEWQGLTIVGFVGREKYEVERPIKPPKDDLAELIQDILAYG
jgi:hypothetical protein